MAALLDAVRDVLAPLVASAGFAPADEFAGSDQDLEWLEYRRESRDGPVLLDIFHDTAECVVTAEIWQPGDLVEIARTGAFDPLAERRRIWRYRRGTGERRVRDDVIAAVAACIAAAQMRPQEYPLSASSYSLAR